MAKACLSGSIDLRQPFHGSGFAQEDTQGKDEAMEYSGGKGHNRRVQKGSVILHGEMDALENAGRQEAKVYRESVLYTTLSPCPMCTGAILLYGIPKVVIGENQSFMGAEDLLRSHGVEVVVLNDEECIRMMEDFIQEHPVLWNEDIGEE
jgi:cytosine deaminase